MQRGKINLFFLSPYLKVCIQDLLVNLSLPRTKADKAVQGWVMRDAPTLGHQGGARWSEGGITSIPTAAQSSRTAVRYNRIEEFGGLRLSELDRLWDKRLVGRGSASPSHLYVP